MSRHLRVRRLPAPTVAALVLCALAACSRASEERYLAEADVGLASGFGVDVVATDGLAVVRAIEPGKVTLWAAAPGVQLRLSVAPAAAGRWQLVIENALPDAVLVAPDLTVPAPTHPRPTVLVTDLDLPVGDHLLTLVAPDDLSPDPFRFVAFGDIQTGMPTVDEVFREIATVDPRFVVFMGDLTDRGEEDEYALAAAKLEALPVPFYPTLGNHELWADPSRYRDRYGKATYQFSYRGVRFTFADSGDAGLDPLVEGQLDRWLVDPTESTHVFLTHFPPIDPFGIRDGSFRSRRDAHRLLAKLSAAGVDLTLYGHVHSFLAFENAGIPAFISGGGGAQPERWDGIGRHFLVVDVARDRKPTVGVHRVD